ncbi:hypothetical protein BJF90_29060 [Pseudonocardia sp. CNS-004]|nr:hypothetical protein BJF90_29060 [Pseudonocardia sp. CNS-004]
MSTHATLGHSFIAASRNSSSGAVYSWAASETSSTASALGRADIVAAPWDEPRPPTPGVSTSTSPPDSSLRGNPTSA